MVKYGQRQCNKTQLSRGFITQSKDQRKNKVENQNSKQFT